MDRDKKVGELWFSVHVTLRNDAGKASATDREQTADGAHKHQDVLQAGFGSI